MSKIYRYTKLEAALKYFFPAMQLIKSSDHHDIRIVLLLIVLYRQQRRSLQVLPFRLK